MPSWIEKRIELSRSGDNPFAITKMKSGWVMMADKQIIPGHLIFVADPIVSHINALSRMERLDYWDDVLRVGDALLELTHAYHLNYETLGNKEMALHTHIFCRYQEEPEESRTQSVFKAYDFSQAIPFNFEQDGEFIEDLRTLLS